MCGGGIRLKALVYETALSGAEKSLEMETEIGIRLLLKAHRTYHTSCIVCVLRVVQQHAKAQTCEANGDHTQVLHRILRHVQPLARSQISKGRTHHPNILD